MSYHTSKKLIDAQVITSSLVDVVNYLEELSINQQLLCYDDWLEHDGLQFKKGNIKFSKLHEMLVSPHKLYEYMPEDDYVCIGISAYDDSWYLRIYIQETEGVEQLVGKFDITIHNRLIGCFENRILPILNVKLLAEDSQRYFSKILC